MYREIPWVLDKTKNSAKTLEEGKNAIGAVELFLKSNENKSFTAREIAGALDGNGVSLTDDERIIARVTRLMLPILRLFGHPEIDQSFFVKLLVGNNLICATVGVFPTQAADKSRGKGLYRIGLKRTNPKDIFAFAPMPLQAVAGKIAHVGGKTNTVEENVHGVIANKVQKSTHGAFFGAKRTHQVLANVVPAPDEFCRWELLCPRTVIPRKQRIGCRDPFRRKITLFLSRIHRNHLHGNVTLIISHTEEKCNGKKQ